MARPYSQDLRERMMWAVLSGQSRHEVARMFDVSASCVIKLMQRVDATGDCQPRKFGGHKRYALAEHEDKVRALVAERPDDHRTVAEDHRARDQGGAVGRRAIFAASAIDEKNSACRRAGTPGCQGRPRRL